MVEWSRLATRATHANDTLSTGTTGSLHGVVGWVVGVLLALPNLLLTMGGMVQGGSVFSAGRMFNGGQADRSAGLLVGAIGVVPVLVGLFISAVLAAVAGTRAALRTPFGESLLRRLWSVPFVAVAWLLIASVSRFHTTLHAEVFSTTIDTGGVAGLGIPSTVLMACVWSVMGLLVGPLLARALADTAPTLASLVAGRGLDDGWRAHLDAVRSRRAGSTGPNPWQPDQWAQPGQMPSGTASGEYPPTDPPPPSTW